LPAHVTPADVRNSYGAESTAVDTAVGSEPTYMKYGPPSAAGRLGGQNSGVINYGGYQTTTTTHVPGHRQELPKSNPTGKF
jgi:hypothetical protein